MTTPDQTAEFLLDHREKQEPVDNIPEDLYPASPADAFLVQERVVARRLAAHDGKPVGYKIACTNQRVIDLLNVSGPFPGRLMSHSTHESGATLPAADFRLRVMEAEFAFELGEDVPPGELPHTAETIRPYVTAFVPGLEIVDHSYNDFTIVGEAAIIADNAIHGAALFGAPVPEWGSIDFVHHAVTMQVNGETFTTGSGENVLGDPLYALAWLANHLAGRGITLRAGERVLTGTAGQIYLAKAGDTIRADFGAIGDVNVTFQ